MSPPRLHLTPLLRTFYKLSAQLPQLHQNQNQNMEMIRKTSKVHKAATLKQVLKMKCSSFGRKQRCDESEEGHYVKAPRGHFVVYVGESRSRYTIPISYLENPGFQLLLRMAEDEYGFRHDTGLIIPCDESLFQSLVSVIR